MPDRARVSEFVNLVESGKFVEAIERFYTEDASMQENLDPPRQGRDKLVEHERKVMASVKTVRALPGSKFLVDGDSVVVNWIFEFERQDGRKIRLDEIAYQTWTGDRIRRERFYYDPAQTRG